MAVGASPEARRDPAGLRRARSEKRGKRDDGRTDLVPAHVGPLGGYPSGMPPGSELEETAMRLSGPFCRTKQEWVMLDLLAIALIAGAIWGLVAALTGAWSPLGPVNMWEAWWWGLALFVGALPVIFAMGVLAAVHVSVFLNRRAAHEEVRATSAATSNRVPQPVRSQKPRPAVIGPHG
jgi:hypothetical protein